MDPIRRLAFVVNADKAGANTLAEDLSRIAIAHRVETRITDAYPIDRDFLAGIDACCAIGGDGTLLGVVEPALRHAVRIIGVNLGKLGFLVTFTPEQIHDCFPDLLSGIYKTSRRTVLSACIKGGESRQGLNDVVIRDAESRLIRTEVRTADSLITQYSSDGLIFSTPSGSTAYNLSAGGPILHPESDAIAMTPICPHTLSNRSLVLPAVSTLTVRVTEPESHPVITIDGRHVFEGIQNQWIDISLCSKCLELIHLEDYDYYTTLRSKLAWGSDDR